MIPIQVIIQASDSTQCSELAKQALQAGCKWIQLQTSQIEDAENTARKLQQLCHEHQATFILGSNVESCKLINADGVCLTESDPPANEVRELLGHEYIIGATAQTFEQIKLLKRMSADYICLSLSQDSLANLATITQQLANEEIRIPLCVQSTSTDIHHIFKILNDGANGIALSSNVLQPANLKQTIQQLLYADE